MDPISSRELKRRARSALNGGYALPMSAFAVSQILVLFVSLPFEMSLQSNPSAFQLATSGLASVIIFLLSNVLTGGTIYIHLHIARGKNAVLTDVFRYFNRRPDRFILSALLLTGMSFACMLPAIALTVYSVPTDTIPVYVLTALAWVLTLIPLLFLSLTYALTGYLLVEQPDSRIPDVFRQSRRLMEGHKKQMLYVNVSFLGMYLLSILSAGIGFLWVIPYRSQTLAELYRSIQREVY